MGISSRDYYRDNPPRDYYGSSLGGAFSFTPIVKWLIIANVVVFVAELLIVGQVNSGGLFARPFTRHYLVEWADLDPNHTIYSFQIWRLLTYAFLHDPNGLGHLFFNMLGLFFFGRELENLYGSREFLWFYLGSALGGAILFLFFSLYFRDTSPAIGASGAVMGVLMLYALHFPHRQIYIMFLFAVPVWLVVAFIVAGDFFPLIKRIGSGEVTDNVAHAAHIGGLLVGYLYYQSHFRFTPYLQRLEDWFPQRHPFTSHKRSVERPILKFPGTASAKRPTPNVKVYHEPASTQENRAQVDLLLEQRVDQILAKISREGETSLTDDERTIMREAAEAYKRRKRE